MDDLLREVFTLSASNRRSTLTEESRETKEFGAAEKFSKRYVTIDLQVTIATPFRQKIIAYQFRLLVKSILLDISETYIWL